MTAKFETLPKNTLSKNVNDYIYFKTVDCALSLSSEMNITAALTNWVLFIQERGLRETAASLKLFRDTLREEKKSERWIYVQLQIIKAFYKWLCDQGKAKTNPMANHKITMQLTAPPEKAFSKDEIQTILANCKTVQERCWVGLMLVAGLRTSEVVNLLVEQIDFENFVIKEINNKRKIDHVGSHIKLDPQLFHDLKTYMEQNNITSGKLFDVADHTFYFQLKSKILPRGTPHLLRKTAGVLVYRKSNDLKLTQLFMRHSNMETTSRYLDSIIVPKEEQVVHTVWDV